MIKANLYSNIKRSGISLRPAILSSRLTPQLYAGSGSFSYYSTASTLTNTSKSTPVTPSNLSGTSKTLKPSSFAQPTPAEQAPDVPQQDIDDFNITKLIHGDTDLQIAITSRASRKLTSIADLDKNPRSALKIDVESGGCHGFQYNLVLSDIDKEIAKAKEEDQEDELLIFQRQEKGQTAYLVLDESSLQILQDSKIDYTKELIGSSFQVVDSPYTSTACGCGASFDFDFEKLEQKMKEKKEREGKQ